MVVDILKTVLLTFVIVGALTLVVVCIRGLIRDKSTTVYRDLNIGEYGPWGKKPILPLPEWAEWDERDSEDGRRGAD